MTANKMMMEGPGAAMMESCMEGMMSPEQMGMMRARMMQDMGPRDMKLAMTMMGEMSKDQIMGMIKGCMACMKMPMDKMMGMNECAT
jgi:hypothetical protein